MSPSVGGLHVTLIVEVLIISAETLVGVPATRVIVCVCVYVCVCVCVSVSVCELRMRECESYIWVSYSKKSWLASTLTEYIMEP